MMTLPGCQGRKVVARVNGETINEDDFTNRALRVTNINPQAGMDAGGMTLVNMIKEDLVLQLAKSKGITISDDQVSKYVAVMEKLNPQLSEGVRAGKITSDELNREYKLEMVLFAVGTDNAKADSKELQAAYDQHKAELTIQGVYRIRPLALADQAKAEAALAELKKSGDFQKAAAIGGVPPEAMANMGKETPIPVNSAPPALKSALDTLKPTDFTAAPIPLQNSQTGQPFYVIAQLIDKTTDHVLTLDESRPRVERIALTDKFPQWGTHADTAISDFITQSKDNIQINIDRYKPLKEQFILPKPKVAMPAQAPPTGATPPPGASAPVPGAKTPAPGGKM
jgi:hypothetical protein